MSKQLHTDDDVFAACENVRSSGRAVTVRNVYALASGNWPRIARLVSTFNVDHSTLAQMTRAYEDAVLTVQDLTIENDRLTRRLNEQTHQTEEFKAKLIESDRNATLMLQAAMEELLNESAMHPGGSQ